VIVPSLHLNVTSGLEDNDASTLVGPSLHLHTSLRCLEAKMWTRICHKSVDSSYARCSRSPVVLIPPPTRSHVQLQCTNVLAKGRSQLFWMRSELTMGDLQNFGKLGKKSVFFFQSRGAKKSKITYKISSRQEVSKKDRVKIVLVVK
jgi:hypothetical protein